MKIAVRALVALAAMACAALLFVGPSALAPERARPEAASPARCRVVLSGPVAGVYPCTSETVAYGGRLAVVVATPPGARARAAVPAVDPAWTGALETAIDRFEAELPPLRHFVLPGGTPLAADLHHARAVCRRAERRVVALHRREPVDAELLAFLNRLSDFLFVAARIANHRAGAAEIAWDPHARG